MTAPFNKMEKWLVDCMVINTLNTKFNFGSPQVQGVVYNTRSLSIGEWVQILQWSCYIEDVRALLSSCYKLVDKRKDGNEKQRENRMRKEPCKSFKDAVMWMCESIGVSGQANDRRHHQLPKILKGVKLLFPYLASDPLTFHDHGDPSAISISTDNRANVLCSVMTSDPNLQVEVSALTFFPVGPYPMMNFC
jgi:hypothetical protein